MKYTSKLTDFLKRWGLPIIWVVILLSISATPEPFRFIKDSSIDSQINLTIFGHSIIDLLDFPYHFLMYLVLGVLIARGLIWQSGFQFKFLLLALILLMSIALIDELQQIAVPKRNFQVIDLVMDGLGGMAGVGVKLAESLKLKAED